MMADIRVIVLDKDDAVITGRKFRHGVKKRDLHSTLERLYGASSLVDSEDYNIEASDDLVVAGEYCYIQNQSSSIGNPNCTTRTHSLWFKCLGAR